MAQKNTIGCTCLACCDFFHLLIFFKINVFKRFFQEYHQIVKGKVNIPKLMKLIQNEHMIRLLCSCLISGFTLPISDTDLLRAQWLSDRGLDLRSRGCGLEHHDSGGTVLCCWARHFILCLSTGSPQEDPPPAGLKNCWLGPKESNQTNKIQTSR